MSCDLMANAQVCTEVLLDDQVLVIWRILNHKPLLVRQMQRTDEAVTRGNIGELLL